MLRQSIEFLRKQKTALDEVTNNMSGAYLILSKAFF